MVLLLRCYCCAIAIHYAVCRASELFAKSLVTMAGGNGSDVSVNASWVSAALRCLLSDWNCDFFAPNVNSEKVG
jgi:hypothetical protein